jgi:hypothetical protein
VGVQADDTHDVESGDEEFDRSWDEDMIEPNQISNLTTIAKATLDSEDFNIGTVICETSVPNVKT